MKILKKTDVTKYLEFRVIEGSYVYARGKTQKVPATAREAMTTACIGLLEKRRFSKLVEFALSWNPNSGATYRGSFTYYILIL